LDFRDFIRYGEEITEDLRLERYHQISKGLDVDSAQWFRNNYDWMLADWIMDKSIHKSYHDPEISVMTKPPGRVRDHLGQEMPLSMQPEVKNYQMQKFRLHRGISHTALATTLDYKAEMGRLKEGAIREHIHDILRHCVFGLYIKRIPREVEGAIIPAPHSMAGFVEQKGRLPRPGDQITMAVLGDRFLQMAVQPSFGGETEDIWLTTECCIIAH